MVAHSSLRVRQLGPSSESQALMVRIDWTKSQVVTITAHEDFKMSTVTMWVRKGGYKIISTQDVPVHKGTKLYFVASNEQGWYYLLKWSESRQQYACTCPSGRIRHNCRHQHILADHLESKDVQTTTREMKVFVSGGYHYEPRFCDADGQWQSFKDEQGQVIWFCDGTNQDLAHKYIEIDTDEHRSAVWSEYQQRLAEYREVA